MDEDNRPITGAFEDAVEALHVTASALYRATFEDIGEHHGNVVSAMGALRPFTGGLVEAIDAWYVAEEGAFPGLDEPYGEALADVIDNFNGIRNNIGRVTGYVHSYNEFHNSISNLVSFCGRWDYERGSFVPR